MRALGIAMTAAACGRAGTPPAAPPPVTTAAPTAMTSRAQPISSSPPLVAPSSAALDAACERLAVSQRDIARRARSDDEELRGAGTAIPKSMGTCLRAKGARDAWVIALDSLADSGCAERSCATLRFHLAHVAADGGVVEGPPKLSTFTAGSLSVDVGALFDADGDGDAELLVRTKLGHVACSRGTTAIERGGLFVSFRGGAIREISSAVEDARDTDGDGVPELVTRGPYSAIADRPCVAHASADSSIALFGPELLLRVKPDLTLATSLADARRACPETPPGIVARPKSGRLDLLLTARNVVCARLWGASTDDVVRALETSRSVVCDGAPGTCPELDVLSRWATIPPPVLLTR